MMLAEEGRIQLTEAASKHLPPLGKLQVRVADDIGSTRPTGEVLSGSGLHVRSRVRGQKGRPLRVLGFSRRLLLGRYPRDILLGRSKRGHVRHPDGSTPGPIRTH